MSSCSLELSSLMKYMTLVMMLAMMPYAMIKMKSKIMTLLNLEMIMLMNMASIMLNYPSMNNTSVMMMMMIMMVLESTMGLSIMISSTRNSSETSQMMEMI